MLCARTADAQTAIAWLLRALDACPGSTGASVDAADAPSLSAAAAARDAGDVHVWRSLVLLALRIANFTLARALVERARRFFPAWFVHSLATLGIFFSISLMRILNIRHRPHSLVLRDLHLDVLYAVGEPRATAWPLVFSSLRADAAHMRARLVLAHTLASDECETQVPGWLRAFFHDVLASRDAAGAFWFALASSWRAAASFESWRRAQSAAFAQFARCI